MDRFYIAVREDLDPGLQLAQVAHVAIQAGNEWPIAMADWHEHSNNVVIVGVEDERALHELALIASVDVPVTVFTEPDLNDAATAMAIRPGPDGRRICSCLPLAGKQRSKHQ